MRVNSISPELPEVTDTAYGDVSHTIKFYARSKVESDMIYNHHNNSIVHRSAIPNTSIETTPDGANTNYYRMGVGNEQSEATNIMVLASVFNNILKNELNDTLSETCAVVATKIAASVVVRLMLTHNIIVDIDATAKVNERHDTSSIVPMEPLDEFVSDDKFECIDNDNIIIQPKDVSVPNTSTDLVL